MPFLRRTILGAALAMPTAVQAQLLFSGPNGQEHEARPEVQSFSIPFVSDAGHLLTKASVAGSPPVPFVLDTGSSLITLDRAFAEQMQIRADSGIDARGAGGSTSHGGFVRGLDIRIGGRALPQRMAAIVPLPNHLTDRGSRPRIAGLIGCNGFGGQALRVDFVQRLMTWRPSADDIMADLTVPMAVQMSVGRWESGGTVRGLTVPVTIGGQERPFLLDTGSPSPLLTDDLADSVGLLDPERPHVDYLSPGGIDGPFPVTAVVCEGWSIAGHTVSPFIGLVRRALAHRESLADPKKRRRPQEPGLSLFGPGVLHPKQLVVDIPRERLLVSFSKAMPQRPRFQSFGLSLTKPARDTLEVLSVMSGSPAAAQGIGVGDRIVAVNDLPARFFSLAGASALINNSARIRFENGRIVQTMSATLLS